MTPNHLYILLLALFATSVAQNDDELRIPDETDNQFPPVVHNDLDVSPTEGSGAEEHLETTTVYSESPPPLEEVQLSSSLINNESDPSDKLTCPDKCMCNTEGDTDKYTVNCSDAELTELPQPLDPKTTELNLQNNKLTILPKDIAQLKNLRILNVDNNQIMDIAAGSISELPELTSFTLRNNRLMEYPTDFKNSFGLTKLQGFDFGGNDMRTVLKAESFSIFKALRTLTLPSATPELLDELCVTLKESLVTICIESCTNKQHDCPDAPDAIDDLDIVIPALIPSEADFEENEDVIKTTTNDPKTGLKNEENVANVDTTTVESVKDLGAGVASFHSAVIKAEDEIPNPTQTESTQGAAEPEQVETNPSLTNILLQPEVPETDPTVEEPKPTVVETKPSEEVKPVAEEPLPTDLEPKPSNVEPTSTVVEPEAAVVETEKSEPELTLTRGKLLHTEAAPNSNVMTKTESEVVGATTSSAKSGGVDKSIIGLVVAGMVLIVAGITIKKNWSSIRKRFSSSTRNANDRTPVTTNGTAPEEVPLQEKSPV